MQTPLTDPFLVMGQIREGYEIDPLYADTENAKHKREQYGITGASPVFWKGIALAVPDAFELHRRILRELHTSPYAGHMGMHRTESLISRYFYWPGLQKDVHAYVGGCVICQRSKAAPGKQAGKLQPLPVPSAIWEDISMDFVGPLPTTARHYDYILVVVDRLSKMAHFLPCKSSIDGPGVAQLFVERIWSLHGLPASVVTDRGRQFLNEFNAALCKLIGTQHAVSSAYHPETDGQTERVNRILGEMLRHYTNWKYDNWDLNLPLVEFAHNNAPSSATGMTPFFCCYGKHPRTPMNDIVKAANLVWESEPQANKQFLKAHDFVAEKREIVQMAQAAMENARQRMIRQQDPKRRELSFSVGDQVSLKTKHLGVSTLPSAKLFQRYMGPFTISKVINPVAYQLELPKHWKAHNVFHVSLLKPYVSNGEAVDPQSFTLTGGADNEFEVESIYDYLPKTAHANGKHRKVSELIYLIKWRGQPKGMHARQPYKNVKGSAEAALTKLAGKFGLPPDLFHKGSNKVSPGLDHLAQRKQI